MRLSTPSVPREYPVSTPRVPAHACACLAGSRHCPSLPTPTARRAHRRAPLTLREYFNRAATTSMHSPNDQHSYRAHQKGAPHPERALEGGWNRARRCRRSNNRRHPACARSAKIIARRPSSVWPQRPHWQAAAPAWAHVPSDLPLFRRGQVLGPSGGRRWAPPAPLAGEGR
jgi:hypothetical protein